MVQSTMFGTNPTMEPLAASDVSPAVLRLHYAGRGARARAARQSASVSPRRRLVCASRQTISLGGALRPRLQMAPACSVTPAQRRPGASPSWVLPPARRAARGCLSLERTWHAHPRLPPARGVARHDAGRAARRSTGVALALLTPVGPIYGGVCACNCRCTAQARVGRPGWHAAGSLLHWCACASGGRGSVSAAALPVAPTAAKPSVAHVKLVRERV